MDVEAEIRAADRRIRRQIDESARAAIARMDERWPSLTTPVVEAPRDPMQAYGQWLRALHDGFVALAQSFAAGWTAVDRARPLLEERQ